MKDEGALEEGVGGKSDKSWWDREGYTRSESEERIVPPGQAKVLRLEVWETKEFDIDRSDGQHFARDGQDVDTTRMYDGGDKNTTTVTAGGSPMGRKSESSGESR